MGSSSQLRQRAAKSPTGCHRVDENQMKFLEGDTLCLWLGDMVPVKGMLHATSEVLFLCFEPIPNNCTEAIDMTFISEAEMTAKYAPKAFAGWFNARCKSIIQDDVGKVALRMREGLCKKFIEEIYPLKMLAEFEFMDRDDVVIQWINGNQNYDALIFSSTFIHKIEITNAVDEIDYYRRWMINEVGWAPLDKSRIEKRGNKNAGNMRIEAKQGSAMDIGTFFDTQIELVNKAIDKKESKDYETGTSLLVMFDDFGFQHLRFAYKTLNNLAKEKSLEIRKFSRLYLIGSHKNIYVKCDCLN
jgi:hypothetical protein